MKNINANKAGFQKMVSEWQAAGGTLIELAEIVGKSRQTIYNYMHCDTLDKASEANAVYYKTEQALKRIKQKKNQK